MEVRMSLDLFRVKVDDLVDIVGERDRRESMILAFRGL